MLFGRNSDFFVALLYTNRVTEFKYIYDDLTGKVEKNYYLNDQIEKISDFIRSPKARTQLYKEAEKIIGEYRHSKSVRNKVKKAEKEAEEE